MKFTINPNKKRPSDSSPFNPQTKPTKPQPKNEQQHLADVYASFVKSFDGPSLDTTNFVHGGSLDPNSNKQIPSKEAKTYRSSAIASSATPTAQAILGSRKLTARDLARLKKEQQKSNALKKKKGGTRQIHLLFEEMKARQERDPRLEEHTDKHREEEDIHSNTLNSVNIADYNASTNLYVGNLPLNICETELMEVFGKYGIIASVKIMWPRTEQEHARDRLCGFVSYLRRCDAELALAELKDVHLFGERLRLGWGKPVVGSKEDAVNISDGIDSKQQLCLNMMEYQVPPSAIRYVIRKPDNKIMKQIIDRTAFYVAQFGAQFESAIIDCCDDEFSLQFLVDSSDLNKYYRWRVYSISMGDSLYKWRVSPFQMIHNGAYWIPPIAQSHNDTLSHMDDDIFLLLQNAKCNKSKKVMKVAAVNNCYAFDEQRDRRRLTSRPLSDRDRNAFMTMLRQLNCKRFKIKEAMIFCLDHSEFGKEVCEILAEALTLNETVFNKKLARLLLVSDVLCNCNTAKIKNASLYRSEFKNKHLMKIFKSLHYLLVSAADKKMIKEQVLKVIKVWENQCVFPSFFTKQLKQIFIYGEKLDKNVILNTAANNNINNNINPMMKKLREKNLVYPPHAKLFIAKKGNNPNKAFTSYSFAKLKNTNQQQQNNNIHKEKNHFIQMISIKKKEQKKMINNVKVGKYDGDPLPLNQCIDIRLL